MKCRKCGGRAALELRRHNTAFCGPDFVDFFRHHVLETVRRWRMLTRDEPVLVAVSGGKDSLALWDVLHDAGYRTTGLYLDLGIFDYSRASKARCEAFAAERGLDLRVVAVADAAGRADSRGPERHAAPDLLRLRAVEAVPHESRRAGGRVPGGGHGAQPRRRGRHPVRLHAPLGRIGAGATDAGAGGDASQARAAREAALPDERARDGRVRLRPRHRLHRGGVSLLARGDVDRAQGGAQSPRGHVAGLEGDVPPGLPRAGARAVPGPGDRDARRVRALRPDHDRGGLRVLQAPRSGDAGGAPPESRARGAPGRAWTFPPPAA